MNNEVKFTDVAMRNNIIMQNHICRLQEYMYVMHASIDKIIDVIMSFFSWYKLDQKYISCPVYQTVIGENVQAQGYSLCFTSV